MKNFKNILPVFLVAVLGLVWAHRLAVGASAQARIKVEGGSGDAAGGAADDEGVSVAPYDPYFIHVNGMILNPDYSAEYSIPTPKGFHHKKSTYGEISLRNIRDARK